MTELAQWSTVRPGLMLVWSASSLKSFMQCPRRHYYEKVRGYVPAGSTHHLDFGKLWHSALAHYDRARCAGTTLDEAMLTGLQALLEETWIDGRAWETGDSAKNRANLIRAFVWYCDWQASSGPVPYKFPDGTPALELDGIVPLPAKAATGEQFYLRVIIDSIVEFGGEKLIRERKTTAKTLGTFYFRNYSPSIQLDTYDLFGYLLFADLGLSGILVEAAQTLVGSNAFAIQEFHHTDEQREEWLREILGALARAETYADEYEVIGASDAWPMNRAGCNLDGGCPYRGICGRDPRLRERLLTQTGEFVRKE